MPQLPIWGTDKSFYGDIVSLGLGPTLKLCLDAGCSRSYIGSGQNFANLVPSGGANFTRGSGGGTGADDPTFNGTPNAETSNEYFSVNGSQFFTISGSNPAWINALHKNNATATYVMWMQMGYNDLSNPHNFMGDANLAFANVGITHYIIGNGLRFTMSHGSSPVQILATVTTVPFGSWFMYSCSHDEAGGAGASFLQINDGTPVTFDGAYTSPSSSSATYRFQILAGGNDGTPAVSGSQVARVAIWNSALSQTDIAAVFNKTRGIYGV